MRKIVTSLFITLDGVAEEPSDWQDEFDEEMGESLNASIASTDAIILGRVTYEYWNNFWPTADFEPFASYINNTQKYVLSNTLEKVEWGDKTNIELLSGDVAQKLKALKQQLGKNITVAGSPSVTQWLLQNDLMDELTLLVHPVIAGKGARLFKDGVDLKRLTLTSNTTTRSGVAIMTYTPRV